MTSSPESADNVGSIAEREIVVSRFFKAPRALVYATFTDVKHISNWWGPVGFTTTTSHHDVRPGGEWVFVMHGPDGTDFPNWIRYKVVQPPELLVYDHGGETPKAPVNFVATITFVERDGGTEITMRTLMPTKAMRDLVVNNYGAIKGGEQNLLRLSAQLDNAGADRSLTTRRSINAPREKIWKALTTPDLMARWWGPNGFTNTFAVCDVRPGGDWQLTMHGPGGAAYPNQSRFVELSAPERWVIEHVSGHVFTLSMILLESATGTELYWCQTFAKAADCRAMRAICEPANEQNIDRLVAVLATMG